MTRIVCLALVFAACGGAAPPQATSQGPDALLRFQCTVKDAELWLDGRFLAEVREVPAGVLVAPGPHRLIVRRDGYHETYLWISADAGQTQTLAIDLAERFTTVQ
jgi:hypothetical protein